MDAGRIAGRLYEAQNELATLREEMTALIVAGTNFANLCQQRGEDLRLEAVRRFRDQLAAARRALDQREGG